MERKIIDVEWWPAEAPKPKVFVPKVYDPAVWAPHQIARRKRHAERYHEKCQMREAGKRFLGALAFFILVLLL